MIKLDLVTGESINIEESTIGHIVDNGETCFIFLARIEVKVTKPELEALLDDALTKVLDAMEQDFQELEPKEETISENNETISEIPKKSRSKKQKEDFEDIGLSEKV